MTDHPNTFAVLRFLVERAKCKPNWCFKLTAVAPMELLIKVTGPDSRGEFSEDWTIAHHFPVPYATYNEKTWRRWIFDCCRKVEDHELSEWFRIDDERPFAPLHGPGEDPYTIHEFRDTVDAYMNQDGSVRGKTADVMETLRVLREIREDMTPAKIEYEAHYLRQFIEAWAKKIDTVLPPEEGNDAAR